MKLHHLTQGEGPPLLILHGLFGSSDNWRSIAAQLASDRRIITVDLRNHGQSPHSDVVSYQTMADDIVELMDDLDLKQVDVIGHSIGGKVAMTLTEQHPESINNLIVVDIAPKTYPDRHRDIFEALLAIDLKQLTKRSDADSQLARKIKNKAIRQFLLMNLMKEADGFKWRPNLSVLSDLYSKLIEPVCQNKTINHRGLFIRGGLSDYIEDKDIEMIKQQFPNARVATIDQAGHWVHAELPSQFLTLIRQFLSYD